ncbi:MAG: hypothetical protein AB7N70_26715, partial [Dehalococcoidia bacterium]
MNIVFENPEGYCANHTDRHWNQSLYFNFYDPATRIGCFIRIGIQENKKESNNWFVFFKDGRPLFTRSNLNLPYTPDRMDKGLTIAGLTVKAIVPLKVAHLRFQDEDFQADLTFEAIHPMMDAVALTGKAGDAFAKELGATHLEAPCRVTGTVTVDNAHVFNVDCLGIRDISVGPRNWHSLAHFRTAWPLFLDGKTFLGARAISMKGQVGDMRMFHDGEQWLAVTQIEETAEWAEDQMTYRSMHWKFRDALDRDWEFTAKPIFRWFFPIGKHVMGEHMMEYHRSDGV